MANGYHKIETRCFINNEFVEAKETFALHSPSTGELTANVCQAGEDLVNSAVDAAHAAFPAWSALDAPERAKCLIRLADLLVEHAEELSRLEALSMGKVAAFYPPEVQWAADILKYFAGLAREVHGESSLTTAGMVNMTFVQPYGVCGAIVPWNGPLVAMSLKVGPALAAGNTLLLKPSEKSPLTALYMGKLIPQAGFPPGVLNILPGHGRVTGAAIASHMRIRKLAFTGSTRTGRIIKKLAAESNLKDVTLELGGKSPLVVFPDADLEETVAAAAFSIAMNSGQICMASSRVYVHESIGEKFVEAYVTKFKEIMGKAGDALDPNTTHAPQADAMQYESIMKHFETAKNEGASPITGGKRIGEQGYFIEPTVYLNPGHSSSINREEVFGPVAVINTFSSEEEVLKLANDTEYGLYASVYTKDISRALRFAKQLESGMVGVNCTSPTMAFDLPFGGTKQSGEGRESSLKSLHSWTELKTVMIKI
ncbi:aldehyde dehydrogenase [Exophiala viscosa]|uniref:aldehyde dehydrogenase n=1 Tax=Exophiala viscosa TaxID=2486360 RepID=UPI00219ACB4F|nr:aldehyde dehydrogenase [Exophiala viscosa]